MKDRRPIQSRGTTELIGHRKQGVVHAATNEAEPGKKILYDAKCQTLVSLVLTIQAVLIESLSALRLLGVLLVRSKQSVGPWSVSRT
jgi:hypothetical protein